MSDISSVQRLKDLLYDDSDEEEPSNVFDAFEKAPLDPNLHQAKTDSEFVLDTYNPQLSNRAIIRKTEFLTHILSIQLNKKSKTELQQEYKEYIQVLFEAAERVKRLSKGQLAIAAKHVKFCEFKANEAIEQSNKMKELNSQLLQQIKQMKQQCKCDHKATL
jgi:hypothetical protein